MSEVRKIPISDRRRGSGSSGDASHSGLQGVSESPSGNASPSQQSQPSPASEGVADASHSGLQGVSDSPSGNASPPQKEPDYLGDLQRLQAEFENYRKRMMREQSQLAERASLRLIERLLPVLDDLERAVQHGGGGGVDLVLRSFKDVLAAEGVEEIAAEGRPFDPRVHEAFALLEDPSVEEPTCRAVMRTGYRLNDQVIRPAMVSVARPPEATADVDVPDPQESGGNAEAAREEASEAAEPVDDKAGEEARS